MNSLRLYGNAKLNTKKPFTPKRVQHILEGKEKTNFPIELLPIVQFMAMDSDYRLTEAYVHQNRLFIRGETVSTKESNDFMLRLNSGMFGYANSLVVARIRFVNRRCGNMTKLYHLLKAYQTYYGTGPIIIENARSEEMIRWCEKNGFREIIDCTYIEANAIKTSNFGLEVSIGDECSN